MRKFVTDYLQKLSSTATPLEGRTVNVMDELITRELGHRILDESKNPPPASHPGLVSRLFPGFEFLDQDEFIASLNESHRKSQMSAAADVTVNPHRLRATVATTRNLRPRHNRVQDTKGEEGRGGLKTRKSKTKKTKGPNSKRGGDNAVKVGHSAEILYNTRKKGWNLEATSSGVASVNKEFITQIEEDFARPKESVVHNFDDAVPTTVPSPIPVSSSPNPTTSSPGDHPSGSSQLPLTTVLQRHSDDPTETDIEEVEVPSRSSSFEGPSRRRGAAYDGDSSRDQDYFEGRPHNESAMALTMESRHAAFMNALAVALLLCDPEQSKISSHVRRRWYGTFSTKELATEDGESHWSRKPDLLLLECASGSDDHNHDAVTWKSPKAIGEMTLSKFQDNKTLIKSLNTKAYILLSCQPWRRHVIGISFAADELRVHFFDRSGVQISNPINWHRRVKETCKIIYALAHGDSSILGFDTTIHLNFYSSIPRSLRPPFIGTVTVDGVEYDIVSILWASNGFIGRGTVCFHVRQRGAPMRQEGARMDEYDLVLKDSWVEKAFIDHECSILEELTGMEGVPSLIKAWTVREGNRDDDTLRYRPQGWTPPKGLKFVHRVHRRLLMTPVGSPFSSFRSHKELLAGLIQGLETHERLVTEKGILHRDISPNNMVFKWGPESVRKLLLIDFDYAARLNQLTPFPQGTGTLPYVSLAILRKVVEGQVQVQHEVSDDLESFFYVFIWVCITFACPNKPIQPPRNVDHTSIFHAWGEGALAPGGLSNTMNAKNTFIHAPNDIINRQFTSYFSHLKPLAERWKDLVKDEDIRRARYPEQDNSSQLTHQTIISLLREYMNTPPDPKVYPVPPGPEPEPLVVDLSSTTGSKRPPSPSFSLKEKGLTKRRRNNSSGSIGTVWLPSRQLEDVLLP